MSNEIGHITVRIPVQMATDRPDPETGVSERYVEAGHTEVQEHEVDSAWIHVLAAELSDTDFFATNSDVQDGLKAFFKEASSRASAPSPSELEIDGTEVGHIVGRATVVLDYETGEWEHGTSGYHFVEGGFTVTSYEMPPHVFDMLEERVECGDFFPDVVSALSRAFPVDKHPYPEKKPSLLFSGA